jgi:hypothetical protein
MAGNSFFGFPEEFFENNSRSDGSEVIYGDLHPDFHALYDAAVSQSDTYSEMNDAEKLIMADEFMELFYFGGVSRADQDEWLHILGLSHNDFDWEEYRAIYDSI